MNEVVERLAKKWVERDLHPVLNPKVDNEARSDTRWWLNTIADELDREDADCCNVYVREDVSDWLRAEALDKPAGSG